MRKLGILAVMAVINTGYGADPVVSNVRASQPPGKPMVNILYDLNTTKTVSVSVAVSTNAGLTFDLPAASLDGSGYGPNITAGTNKQITWDAGKDQSDFFSTSICVKVTARTTNVPSRLDLVIPEEPIPPLEDSIVVSSNWTGSYFIPPPHLLTPVCLFFDTNGQFIVNELGAGTLTRVTMGGETSRYYQAEAGMLFAIGKDAADNAYLWDNRGSNAASLIRVTPQGVSTTYVNASELLHSDWDSGVFAAASNGAVFLQTKTNNTHRLLKIEPHGQIQTVAYPHEVEITSMAFDASDRLFISTAGSVYELDKETGGLGPTLYCNNSNTWLGLGALIHEGLAVDRNGCFYISDGARLAKVWPTGETELLARDFYTIQGIAVDATGAVYTVSRADGGLYRIADETISLVATPGKLSTPQRLAFNSSGELYVYERESLRVSAFDTNAAMVRLLTTNMWISGSYGDIAFDAEDNLYVTAVTTPYPPYFPMLLIRVTPDGNQTTISSNLYTASALAMLGTNIYATENNSNRIYRVTGTETMEIFTEGVTSPGSLDFNLATSNMFVTSGEKSVAITRVTPAQITSNLCTQADSFMDLAVSGTGRIFASAQQGGTNGLVHEIGVTGQVVNIVSGLDDPSGLAVDTDGNLFICDLDKGCVIKLEEK